MSMIPELEGTISIGSPADRFFQACRQRVAAGLLTGQPHRRSNYVVSGASHDHVEIRARFALGLSGGIGLIGIILLLGFDARGYIADHESSMVPGLSIEQNLGIAWLMVLFWGFVWPWLLISLHERPLRELITRLIAEMDAAGVSAP